MRAVIRKAQEKQKLARPSSQSDLYCSSTLHYLPYGAGSGVAPATEHDMYGNPVLGNILQAKQQPNNNAMLMSMLNDVPPAPSTFLPGNNSKPRKQKKRKAENRSPGSSSGKSPKRKMGEEDLLPAEGESNDMHYDMNLPYSSLMDSYGRSDSSNPGFPLNQENKFHPPSGDNLSETASLSHDVYNAFPKGQFPPSSNENNTSEFNFPEAGSSEVPMEGCETGSFGMGFNPAGLMLDQRQSKKMKRYKMDNKESEDSNNESSDDQAKSGKTRLSPILSTSIKIAKSSDGLKVSKSESKQKKKEGKRLANLTEGSEEFPLKRRGESKKERKRKRIEGSEGGEGKQTTKPHHYTLEPSATSEVGQAPEGQTVRPITLNMKPLQSSKSPVSNKKSPSSSCRSSSPINKIPKLSQGDKSFSSKALKVSSSESGNAKITLSTKTGSKHKVSSSSKGSSHSSFSSHSGSTGSSKSKMTHVLKLKHLPLPASTTITPISSSSPTPSPPPPSSQGSSSPSINKAFNKPKKSSLNAVINKLIVTASSNAQQGSPFGGEQPGKPEGGGNYKLESEQRRSKDSSSKDAAKESEKSEKMKYSSSDQFTVKPSSSSSQGINLKIMLKKTASGDGSKSSSKLKSSKPTNSPLKSSNPSKSNSPSNKKLSSPKSKVPRSHSPSLTKSSSKDPNKSSSKLSSSSLPRVSSNSSGNNGSAHHKTSEKSDKPKSSLESKVSSQEIKNDKVESNLMPPPPSTGRVFAERPSSTPPTRVEERQSPRLTEVLEEPEGDKSSFRVLDAKPPEEGEADSGKKLDMENRGFIPVEQPECMMEDSSPEDSLVIDCPGTPRSSTEKKMVVPKPAIVEERSEPSPVTLPLKSPVALKSPAVGAAQATNSPMSRPSPCILDDELMDEAVMGLPH